MSYDPCGTKKLDGYDILVRLAFILEVAPSDLRIALEALVQHTKEISRHE